MSEVNYEFSDDHPEISDDKSEYDNILSGCIAMLFVPITIIAIFWSAVGLKAYIVIMVLVIICAIVSVNLLRRGVLKEQSQHQSYWRPDHNIVVMTYGYDYVRESYRVFVSPIILLPPRREMYDAYLAEENNTYTDYPTGEAVSTAARSMFEELDRAGWDVKLASFVEFHKRMPSWQRASGLSEDAIQVRASNRIREFNPDELVNYYDGSWHSDFRIYGGRAPLLRAELVAKNAAEKRLQEQRKREEEQRRIEHQEYKDAMRPLPAWARGENGQVERKRNDFDIIDLNTADETTLRTLPGIGRVRAQAIVIHRRTNGDFSSVEDLLAVDGIGPDVLEKIREMVAV